MQAQKVFLNTLQTKKPLFDIWPLHTMYQNHQKKALQSPAVRNNFLRMYMVLDEQHEEDDYFDNVYPGFLWILYNKDGVGLRQWFDFMNWPQAGSTMPPGYVVQKMNEPKVYRKRLLYTDKHVLFVFIWQDGKVDQRIQAIYDSLVETYEKYCDIYIVTNNYDIQSHDALSHILWDPDASLHKTCKAQKAAMYLVRPDEVIARRSLWLNLSAFASYAHTIFVF